MKRLFLTLLLISLATLSSCVTTPMTECIREHRERQRINRIFEELYGL